MPRHPATQSSALASSQTEDWVQVVSVGPSSHQQTGTCLATEPADKLTTTASVPGRALNRSTSNNDLVKQSTRIKLGARAFSVAGMHVWNQLPTDLKTITDARDFRRKFKSFFIFVSIPLAHTNIVLGYRSFVGGNIHRLCMIASCNIMSS